MRTHVQNAFGKITNAFAPTLAAAAAADDDDDDNDDNCSFISLSVIVDKIKRQWWMDCFIKHGLTFLARRRFSGSLLVIRRRRQSYIRDVIDMWSTKSTRKYYRAADFKDYAHIQFVHYRSNTLRTQKKTSCGARHNQPRPLLPPSEW